MFAESLIKYMKMSQTGTKKLSELTNIAMPNISRYVNGSRVPEPDTAVIEQLARGLAARIEEDSNGGPCYEEILNELNSAARSNKDSFPHEELSRNLKLLISELGIKQSGMAEQLFLSPSTLSRIMAGNYSTRDPEGIVEKMIGVVEKACEDEVTKEKIWKLLQHETGVQRGGTEDMLKLLADWLSGRFRADTEDMGVRFMDIFRNYDPNEYIKAYQIGDIRVPRGKWKLPTTRKYLGPDGMKKGMIDFFRSTARSISIEDIIIYMNTPVAHFAEDPETYRRIMRVGWLLVMQGHKIHVIHNTNRPPMELKLGIETWLPLYMTGQVEPYYVDSSEDNLVYDVLMVSGSAALTGRALKGAEDRGEYIFTKAGKNIAEVRMQAEIMRDQCKHLVKVYDENNLEEYEEKFLSHAQDTEPVSNTSISLPIETMDEELLNDILERNKVPADGRAEVFECYKKRRALLEEMIRHSSYDEVITEHKSTRDFGEEIPVSIPEWVYSKPLYYTSEEWERHIALTEKFAEDNANYNIRYRATPVFGNIHIHARQNSYAIIDRYNGTELHFAFLHPLLVRCFYDFEAPIREEHMHPFPLTEIESE